MVLLLRAARLALGAAVLALAAMPACFNGNGTPPPLDTFYYPTGLAVSSGGNVLYAINSDFDLQWNGGTFQSYDLFQIRQDAVTLINANKAGTASAATLAPIPFLTDPVPGACTASPPAPTNDQSGIGVPIGQACAPPVDSTYYVEDAAIVGAFATDLQLSAYPYGPASTAAASSSATAIGTTLFAPVSGNATVTWATVAADDATSVPPPLAAPGTPNDPSNFAPFLIYCGDRVDDRCAGDHETGNDPNSVGNTRSITMPGEPFGLAQSSDATALVVTSETSTMTSLLTSGVNNPIVQQPAMQFVVDNMPNGGVGVTAVPHDPNAGPNPLCELVGDLQPCVRQAFLQTSRQSAELDLLRYYDDDGSCTAAPCASPESGAVYRPFLEKERSYTITSNSSGTDFRGSAIDISNRLQCEGSLTASASAAEKQTCAQLPARLFIASRTPPSLVVGKVGALLSNGSYDPDSVTIIGNVPLTIGPSKVYLAPIVVNQENGPPVYKMMVFVICFDSSAIYVFDPVDLDSPSTAQPQQIINTGAGPYAMAFDPFVLNDAATGAQVPVDTRSGPAALGLTTYRFAYVGSFTHSYVQVIDLAQPFIGDQNLDTFESVVYTLGKPVPPKGS